MEKINNEPKYYGFNLYFETEVESKREFIWKSILEYFLNKKYKFVEFSVVSDLEDAEYFVQQFRDEFIGFYKGRKDMKLYRQPSVIRFKISSDMKKFLQNKPYYYWHNKVVEDPCILNDDLVEVFGCRTLEGEIAFCISDDEKAYFEDLGIELFVFNT